MTAVLTSSTARERGSATGLGACAAAGLLAVLLTHLLDFGLERPQSPWLDAGVSSSWSHRAVAAMLVLGTLACAAGFLRRRPAGGWWALAALILGLLSVDELSTLHAHVDRTTLGKLTYAPVLLLFAVCVWRLSAGSRHLPAARAGLFVLAASFTVHVLGAHVVHLLGWGTGSWAFEIKVALKEGLELAGWVLALGALAAVAGEPARR